MQELAPEGHVMSATYRNEIPGRVLRPATQGVAAAQRNRAAVTWRDPAEAIVQDTVDACGRVDTSVFRGRVVDQVAQTLQRCNGIDALPEQVARVHLCPDVRGIDLRREPLHRGRVVNHVVRVHFDADLHVHVAGPSVDVLPERDGHLLPLIVPGVQVDAVPVDHVLLRAGVD